MFLSNVSIEYLYLNTKEKEVIMWTNKVTFMDWVTALVIISLASASVYVGIQLVVTVLQGLF